MAIIHQNLGYSTYSVEIYFTELCYNKFYREKNNLGFLTGCLKTTHRKVTGFHKYCLHKSAWWWKITLLNIDRSFVSKVVLHSSCTACGHYFS